MPEMNLVNVMEIAITIAGVLFCATWNKHYIETKDSSIQGYIEYLKEKYYYKKK